MSAVPRRFTFDLDLSRPEREDEPERTVPEALLEVSVAQAREDAYRRGIEDGAAQESARAALALAQAAEALGGQGAQMLAALDEARNEAITEATHLAGAIARKLAAHLVARQPAAEIEALLADCLSGLERAPHLVVRCHPDLAEAVRDIAGERASVAGFTGRLVVMGDPDIGLGDGRIEWADGGLVRDISAISREVDAKINAYLAGRGTGQGRKG